MYIKLLQCPSVDGVADAASVETADESGNESEDESADAGPSSSGSASEPVLDRLLAGGCKTSSLNAASGLAPLDIADSADSVSLTQQPSELEAGELFVKEKDGGGAELESRMEELAAEAGSSGGESLELGPIGEVVPSGLGCIV